MTRTWLTIQVELVSGRGEYYWPRPGHDRGASSWPGGPSRSGSWPTPSTLPSAAGSWRICTASCWVTGPRSCPPRGGTRWTTTPPTMKRRPCCACSWASSSPTSSTWATAGSTSARSDRSGSIPARCTDPSRTTLLRTSAGATCPTSTAGSGAATTAPPRRRHSRTHRPFRAFRGLLDDHPEARDAWRVFADERTRGRARE